jgi:hypothetical protein
MQRFSTAPWSGTLRFMSTLSVVLILGVSYAAAKAVPPFGFAHLFGTAVAFVPPAILIVGLLFVVRGYELGPSRLRIQRLLWHTEVSLEGLTQVGYLPDAMKSSLRIFGNGGLFSITGYYQNKVIGSYRAFVTDQKNCVILGLPKRVLVVSPEDPSAFVQSVLMIYPGVKVRESKTGT